jgi:hypothetical protein
MGEIDMGGSGTAANGFVPMGQSGGGFLSGIPWWVYLIVILVGLAISNFCLVKYGVARRRTTAAPIPGAPPPLPGATAPGGGGSGFLIGGLAAGLLLVVAPLVVMLIMKPWGDNWIVGRWSENPGCVGDSVEFGSDGFATFRGDRKPYTLEGHQITVNGRTETITHNGDQFTVDNETFNRCT